MANDKTHCGTFSTFFRITFLQKRKKKVRSTEYWTKIQMRNEANEEQTKRTGEKIDFSKQKRIKMKRVVKTNLILSQMSSTPKWTRNTKKMTTSRQLSSDNITYFISRYKMSANNFPVSFFVLSFHPNCKLSNQQLITILAYIFLHLVSSFRFN